MNSADRRAAGVRAHPHAPANGAARLQSFAAEMRAQTVTKDGKEFAQLYGYASVVNLKYDMYDMFGLYKEHVAEGAFDATLSQSPDTAYLVNHKGITMARTTNGSLTLSADARGLKTEALVNPERTDVRDLVLAIEDKNITEMSFAFMITDGGWNDTYDEFTINAVDLDRGDVSAVNYGANPYTDVNARSGEIMRDLDVMNPGAARAALERLQARADLFPEDRPPARRDVPEGGGRSVEAVRQILGLS